MSDDDLERLRSELRWLANDWDQRPPDLDLHKAADQIRNLAGWDPQQRPQGPSSGIDWRHPGWEEEQRWAREAAKQLRGRRP